MTAPRFWSDAVDTDLLRVVPHEEPAEPERPVA